MNVRIWRRGQHGRSVHEEDEDLCSPHSGGICKGLRLSWWRQAWSPTSRLKMQMSPQWGQKAVFVFFFKVKINKYAQGRHSNPTSELRHKTRCLAPPPHPRGGAGICGGPARDSFLWRTWSVDATAASPAVSSAYNYPWQGLENTLSTPTARKIGQWQFTCYYDVGFLFIGE